MLVGISLFFGLPLPVLAAQILWVNFIEHSTPAMALALESDERELLLEKPRKRSTPIFNSLMKVIIFLKGTLTVLMLFALFYYSWKSTGNIVYARTMIFAGLAVFPLFSAWSFKSLHSNIWEKNPFKNRFFNLAMLFSFFMLAIAFYVPFLQEILRTVPLSINDWAILVGLGIINIALIEIIKYFFNNKKLA
jgi:Ca2+-transporting ATPase